MSKVERILFLVLSLIVWVYLGMRAANVPLIHDEVVTYIAYIRDATFIPPWCYWDANNHLLNSATSATLTNIFGNSPFAIRMASWLSFLPLVYFIFRIGELVSSPLKRWSLFIPLLTASYFIEFYGLTRGYGMAMSFLMGTLYFAHSYRKYSSKRNLYLTSIFGVLAALGSLSLIVVVGIIYLWILMHWLLKSDKSFAKTIFNWIAVFIVPLLPLVFYVFELKERGLLYYGGDDFIDITLKPFGEMFFTTRDYWWIWMVVFILILSYYVYGIIKNGIQNYNKPNQIFAFVLFVSIAAIFLQHFVLGVNYPADRAALYLFPLLFLTLVFLPVKENKIWPILLFVSVLWFPIETVLKANLKYSKFWIYEYVPKRFIRHVNKASLNDYPPSINGYFLRKYIWDYAQLRSYPYPSTINGTEHPDEWADFMLVDSNRIQKVNLSRFNLVDFDSISGQSLLAQKHPNIEKVTKDTILNDVTVQNEFTNIFEFKGYDWVNKPMAMYFNMDVQASTEIMNCLIISSVFDTNGVEVYTNKYMFDQVNEDWTDVKGWKIKMYLPPFPENVGRFVTYIYNPQKKLHYFPRIDCKLAEIYEGSKDYSQIINP
ncbi:MAG: ArnT family glycosyltransferase [Salibacteraceae bacterium]